MWMITTFGFFSVVRKKGDDYLTVRTRCAKDLDQLRDRYLPALSETIEGAGTDYPYRAKVSHEAFAGALAQIARDIDYSNFKSEVATRQSADRSHTYSDVWSCLMKIEAEQAGHPSSPGSPPRPGGAKRPRPGLRMAYGGVVVDRRGRFLLRKVAGGFDGNVWSFAKGGGSPTETPEQTALREVIEELGVHAEIAGTIPGVFAGGTSQTRYFIMNYAGDAGKFSTSETEAVKWAAPAEARRLLGLSTNPKARTRDLAVLDAALRMLGTET